MSPWPGRGRSCATAPAASSTGRRCNVDDGRLLDLLEKDLEGCLSESERQQLLHALRTSPHAQQLYWDHIEQHVLIGAVLSESRGRDLALLEEGEPVEPLSSQASPAAEARPGTAGRWRLAVWSAAWAALAAGL